MQTILPLFYFIFIILVLEIFLVEEVEVEGLLSEPETTKKPPECSSPAYGIRHHTSEYVSIRQHVSNVTFFVEEVEVEGLLFKTLTCISYYINILHTL